jgi:hypothetical protein
MPDGAMSMPPLPPSFPAAGEASGAPPPGAPPGATTTPGASQVGGSVIKLAMEIDQALKTLAQAVPQLAPFVESTLMQLRVQIGQALQSGAVSSNPSSPEQEQNSFPGGQGRL